jgi:hypothetical protein
MSDVCCTGLTTYRSRIRYVVWRFVELANPGNKLKRLKSPTLWRRGRIARVARLFAGKGTSGDSYSIINRD